MRGLTSTLVGFLVLFTALAARSSFAVETKEWTHLIFLNGNNNLDSFGAVNINQLETVGSTDKVNFVVQWASKAATKTKRLLVVKDNDPKKVTSPTVEEMPRVDMGDWRNLVEFIRWTKERYPAKRYFVSLWNHGSGWHRTMLPQLSFRDINFDDFSKRIMTTQQLGLAMEEAERILGQKVDILGMDACLMAMIEVNGEVADFVDVVVASEETEPGLGWPYDKLASRWVAKPTASPADIARILTDEYLKLYLPGGAGAGQGDVTLSSVDLAQQGSLEMAMTVLADQIKKLGTADLAKLRSASSATTRFEFQDYADLGNFLVRLRAKNVVKNDIVDAVSSALKAYVISNHTTTKFKAAQGVAFWLPTTKTQYGSFSAKYKPLKFTKNTGWDGALEWILR